jgi:uncharacterized protein YfaS (alpha-2-macroglobulin family)
MLAAAYALNSRKDVAQAIVKDLTTGVVVYRDMGWTYGSGLRDQAVIAEALMRMDNRTGAASVVRSISQQLGSGAWFSTQSTAWALMVVSRFTAGQEIDKTMHFTAMVNGKPENRVSAKPLVHIDLPVPNGQRKVTITNSGKNLIYLRLVRTGTPVAGQETPASEGLAMEVSYRTMDGKPLDPVKLEQGTDFQAVGTVRNPGTRGQYQQLALTQVFPSGWEIRNSRLEACCSMPRTPAASTCPAPPAPRCMTTPSTHAMADCGWKWSLRASCDRWSPPPSSRATGSPGGVWGVDRKTQRAQRTRHVIGEAPSAGL